MRKLVSVRVVSGVEPIEGADRIEKVFVDGWIVVAQKGLHKEGDLVVYFEIDSFLPEEDTRYESFMKFGKRTFEGKVGHRVKTVRLKGVYSQGVIIPVSEFPEISNIEFEKDYSEDLGIVKWEKSEATGYNGDAKGSFPWFLRKSDQERIQNVYSSLKRTDDGSNFVGTLKLDGSSVTVYHVDGEKYENRGLGYCSRNQELKIPESDAPFEEQGKFYQGVINSELFSKVVELHLIYGGYYAIQGELVGPGIQGNFEKFDTYQVFAYNIFDIEKQEFIDYTTFKEMSEAVNLQTVPVIYEECKILSNSIGEILAMAEGEGLRASYREGIVWKQTDGTIQFKAISNKYLEKEKD